MATKHKQAGNSSLKAWNTLIKNYIHNKIKGWKDKKWLKRSYKDESTGTNSADDQRESSEGPRPWKLHKASWMTHSPSGWLSAVSTSTLDCDGRLFTDRRFWRQEQKSQVAHRAVVQLGWDTCCTHYSCRATAHLFLLYRLVCAKEETNIVVSSICSVSTVSC